MTLRAFNNQKPQFGLSVFVDETAVITGNVCVGDNSSIWPFCSLRGDLLSISIGSHSNIQDGTVIHTTHESQYQAGSETDIGHYVTIGHKAIIHGCTIHDTTLIGMGAIVMDHAVVESFVIVGAGSVVGPNKVLESGFVWRGNPIRKARELNDDERDFLRYSAEGYVKLKNQHMQDYPNNPR